MRKAASYHKQPVLKKEALLNDLHQYQPVLSKIPLKCKQMNQSSEEAAGSDHFPQDKDLT